MRLTCLKCGHQIELSIPGSSLRVSCVCGEDYTYPNVVNTGTRPNERAAERSRSRAFRAAGLVKNFGGFALGISLLGILFFPVALVGAGIGIYVLTMVRGAVGRYSGRPKAALAVAVGVTVFLAEGALALSWLEGRRVQRMVAVQSSAAEDLRALLRTERLHRATTDTYGTFQEFRFEPRFGLYTLYLGVDDFMAARRDGEEVVDPLPEGLLPGVSEDAFTAVAVANLDRDPALDVWLLDERGEVVHLVDDVVAKVLLPIVADADSGAAAPSNRADMATTSPADAADAEPAFGAEPLKPSEDLPAFAPVEGEAEAGDVGAPNEGGQTAAEGDNQREGAPAP